MENSSLNKAHQYYRKAENHLRHRRFDEAIECHKTAADLIAEALTTVTNPRSLESLKLQRDFHMRQKEVILVKKQQFESHKRAIEHQKQKKLGALGLDDNEDSQDSENASLQAAIYKTMEETDSLLGLLVKKNSAASSDNESVRSFSTTDTDERALCIDIIDCPSAAALLGSKHPKDESTVIEELRILNGQLHSLVYQLVNQLDARVKEVDKLKETIKELEGEKGKVQNKNSSNLKVNTDSSGGTSPYVFSPCSELSPDVHDARVLPPLTPLELPSFQLASFMKNDSTTN